MEPTPQSIEENSIKMFEAFQKAAEGNSRELVYITVAGFIASGIRKLPPDAYEAWWVWFRAHVDSAVTFSYTNKIDEGN